MKLSWSVIAGAVAAWLAVDVADAAIGSVEAVTARDFKTKLGQHDAAIVEFYAPWCGHCKALEPKLNAAAELLAETHPGLNVALFKADAVEQQALGSKYSIQSYPTLKLFYGGSEVEKYEGERETAAIAQYLVDKAASAPSAKQEPGGEKGKRGPAGGGQNNRKGQVGNNNNNKNIGSGNRGGKAQAQAKAQAAEADAAAVATPAGDGEEQQLTKAEKAEQWRVQVGRSAWYLIHSMAAKFPDKPTAEQQTAAIDFIKSLQVLYPCEGCRVHLNEKMGTSVPLVSSRKAFSSWACMLHNLVNEDKGKEHFDCTLKHLDEVYLKDCEGCVVHGSVEDLSGNALVQAVAPVPAKAAAAAQQQQQQPKEKAAPAHAQPRSAAAATRNGAGGGGRGISNYKQQGTCSIADAHTHYWLQADTERQSSELTEGMLTIVFFNAVTCHVCHEIHPVLKQLHIDFADRGLNIISVHHTIYGDLDPKLESQAIDYHALEELPYPILAHQQTATVGEDDRVALPNSLYFMTTQREGFGVPAMAVLKDCKTVWRGMGFQLKQIDEWVRSNADKFLAPAGRAGWINAS